MTTTLGRTWRRAARPGLLGLLCLTGVLLASMAAAPASAAQLTHHAVPARPPARHLAAADAGVTLAHAPAGLRTAMAAALGRPGAAADGTSPRTSAGRSAAQTALVPADGQADFFGFSIAVSGDTALIGANTANHHTGAAYVFVRGARGWTQQAVLTARNGCANPRDGFGASVALNGNTAVVGAPGRGICGIPVSGGIGAAYVFTRTGTTWTQQAQLNPPPPDAVSGEDFGFSVAVSANTALVGADGDSGRGAVFEFTRTGTTWAQTAKFTGSDTQESDAFGFQLAYSEGTLVVGAPFAAGFLGNAYVFTQSGTTFTQQAILTPTTSPTAGEFGRSVALSGNTALIGSPTFGNLTGAAFVFVRTGAHWARQATLASAGHTDVGDSVAISGNTALTGAQFDSPAGTAFEFARTGTTWAPKAILTSPHGTSADRFGFAVAIAGPTALVGAPGHGRTGQAELFPL
jgi:hypothetical protein